MIMIKFILGLLLFYCLGVGVSIGLAFLELKYKYVLYVIDADESDNPYTGAWLVYSGLLSWATTILYLLCLVFAIGKYISYNLKSVFVERNAKDNTLLKKFHEFMDRKL